uniref:Uncharacterized protein n=1 Tax=Arundo donax TaxID=35708 RepID=A0A0A9CDE5_ARUDO
MSYAPFHLECEWRGSEESSPTSPET